MKKGRKARRSTEVKEWKIVRGEKRIGEKGMEEKDEQGREEKGREEKEQRGRKKSVDEEG